MKSKFNLTIGLLSACMTVYEIAINNAFGAGVLGCFTGANLLGWYINNFWIVTKKPIGA